ncbi:hypothetical protein NDU88_002639 [Pleurodeles waltl]|uniref:Uncharacterized protein n=1 Tax=Pleurodeles waltl TaxID=8319 RepID=A0AAV7M164_PLEWA|nr:hypothetical protein NDU88_002639 [Pleurodeles waltl]
MDPGRTLSTPPVTLGASQRTPQQHLSSQPAAEYPGARPRLKSPPSPPVSREDSGPSSGQPQAASLQSAETSARLPVLVVALRAPRGSSGAQPSAPPAPCRPHTWALQLSSLSLSSSRVAAKLGDTRSHHHFSCTISRSLNQLPTRQAGRGVRSAHAARSGTRHLQGTPFPDSLLVSGPPPAHSVVGGPSKTLIFSGF